MKNFKLFEKCNRRIARRVTLIAVLLAMCMPQAWADDRQHYVGVALENPNNYTVKLNVNRATWGWYTYGTFKANLTYEGKKVYIANYQTKSDDNYIWDFQWQLYDGDTQKNSKNILNNTKSENYYDYYIYNYDGNAWYSQQVMNDSRTYFDATGWTGTDIRLVISHAQLQKYHTMYTVTGTKLYYTNDLSFWDNAMGVGVVSGGSSSRKGDQTAYWEWMTDISSNATEYTGLKNYSLNNNDDNKCYLIVNNGKDGETPDIYYESSNYLTYLNKTQTYNTVVKVGAGSYSSANSKATISISSYELTSQGGTTNRTPSISTSASSTTVSACRTATTRLQVGTVDGDYQFDGWYTAATGGSLVSNSTDYTYYPTSANTYYARFSQKAYTLTYYANGGTGSAPAAETIYSGNTITVKDNINLMTKSGKVFAGWATTVDKANAGTIDYAPGATFTAAGNVDLYAVWTDGAYLFQLLGSSTSSDINTTDFEIDADKVTTGYEVNGVNFSKTHAKFKNVASPAVIKGQNYSNKFWIYDATHKKTAIRIYAKNTSSTNYNLCYNLFLEGVTATSDVTVQVDANSSKMISVDASSSKGARLVVAAQNKAIVITQIVAAEMGEVLPKVGETDYELAFPGRAVNTAKINGNIEITPTTALEFGEDPNLQIKKDKYLKFTTAAVTQIQVTTANNQKIRISDSSSSEGGDLFGGSTATHNHTVAAGTWYLSGSTTTALQVSKIKFADAPTITYNANGGSSSMSTSKGVVSENGFTAPSGKTFVNWNDASGGGGTSYAPGDLAHSAVTLYAQWGYALTYDKNTTDAVTNMPTSPVGVKAGSTNLADEVPVRSGYIFVGWQVGGSGTIYQPGASYTMPSSATTLKAKWVAVDMYISDARKKTWSSEISSGTEITNSNIQGSISGGTVVCSNSSGTLGANSDNGIVFDGDGDQITVTVTGLNFVPGSVIAIGAKGRDNNSSHTCGFVVGGLAPTPATVTSSVSANDFRQVYIVTASDGIDGTSSFTLNRKSSTEKVYLYSLYVGGCEEPSCTAAPTVSAATTSTTTATTQVVNCEGISSLGTGDCSITSYGFVYGTSANPTTSDNVEEVGTTYTTTNTAFSKTIESLTPGTTYYVRPYATNGNGTAYGTETYFTTSTVTMTPTLTNVTHTSGATSGIGGSDYTAVFTANTGYSMPNPTVTIGGNAATIVTDYTWSVEGAVGTITIPANKINGNIVITLNSAAAAPSSVAISGGLLYFAGETISLTATPTGGNGPVTYQWYKGGKENGNAIEGATNATYTKASCAFGDAGSYYCKVTCGGSQSTWGQSGNAYDVKIPRLYVKTGHYYDLEKSDFGNVDFTRATASTATASIVLGSNGDYCFNIADGCGHYYGNSGTMQYNNTGWITNVSPQDCGLTTTNAGTYIFTINYSTWSQLTTTITFPSCTDPGLAFASSSKSVTLCDDAPTNSLTNTHSVAVTYTSSDETVATVASDGTLTIKKAGTTTITASSLEQTVSAVTYCADNASYTLTVNASTAAGLAYGTSTVKKDVGDAAFTNTLTNSNGLTVTYTSSDEDVATVASDGEVTIKAAGTTTITASSAQQKVSSTCYAAGSATYTLTVYPVYTVTYNAMGGTCSPTSTNTTTALGKVTLPTPTHASYSFLGWYNTAGTRVGGAGDEYTPTANITLYAKWQGACAGGGGSPTTIVLTDFGKQFSTSGPRYGRAYVGNISGDVHIIESNDAENQKIGDKDSTAIRVDYGSYIKVLGPNATVADYTTDSTFSSVSRVEFRFKMYNANSGGTTTTIDVYVGNSKVASAIEVTGEKTDPFKAISPITISPAKNGAVRIVNTGSGSTNKNIYLDSIAITHGGGSSCYTVTYHGNGSTSGYTNDPRQYASGGYVFVSSNAGGFAKTGGYEFNGWNTKPDGSGDDYDYDGYDNDHFTITKDTTLYAMWRIVINSNTSDLTAYEDVKHKDVRVTNGATLTITQDTTVRNMLVETSSTLNINTTNGDGTGDGVTLATKSLSLKGGWNDDKTKYDMPRVYIDKKSSLTKEEDVVNFDISVNHRNYYPIALPFDVPLNSVDYARSDLASISDYGVHYAIAEHNGQSRANYGSGTGNWTRMEPGSTLKAGKGYILSAITDGGKAIIRFPMTFTDDWTAEGEQGTVDEVVKNVIPVTAYVKDKGETPIANKGWNLLGVPFMSCYTTGDGMYTGDGMASLIQGRFDYSTGKWTEEDVNVYVTIPTHDFTEYIQSPVGEAVLLPGWCFFVQVDETGDLAFLTAKEAQGTDLPYEAPRRQKASMPTLKTGIILSGAEASDKTTILVSDKYSAAEYEINADLEKMFGENGYTLATYTLSGETRLAYNAMNNADIMDVIPVGYRAPEEGEYTFSINPRYAESEAFEQVNLIDYEEGVITNLLQSSYSFTTARTQNDARFAINVVKRQDMPTDIENGASGINDANGPRKVLINDKMYIIVDGKMYDATGKMLK